jgi:hypothetical protein
MPTTKEVIERELGISLQSLIILREELDILAYSPRFEGANPPLLQSIARLTDVIQRIERVVNSK